MENKVAAEFLGMLRIKKDMVPLMIKLTSRDKIYCNGYCAKDMCFVIHLKCLSVRSAE